MRNRLIKKELVICLILLLTAVSVGSSYSVQRNKTTVDMGTPENYLGEIRILHGFPTIPLPLFRQGIFITFEFEPVPEEERHYYFPEDGGKVWMNFTVNFSQRLAVENLIIKRFSGWSFWVSENITDYVKAPLEKECTDWDWETFTHPGEATVPFETNSQNKTLTVYFYAQAVLGLGTFKIPLFPYGSYEWLPDFLEPEGCAFDITIHPT